MKRLYILMMTLSVMALTCVAGVRGSSIYMSTQPTEKSVSCMVKSVPCMVKYTSTTDPVLAVMVDSAEYRSDLTRVYGRLVGRPHTSGRVDAVSLLAGESSLDATDAGESSWGATDIDGVDFRRYFQWEDDGVIAIEIDFPAVKPLKTARLVFTTVRGQSITTINRK